MVFKVVTIAASVVLVATAIVAFANREAPAPDPYAESSLDPEAEIDRLAAEPIARFEPILAADAGEWFFELARATRADGAVVGHRTITAATRSEAAQLVKSLRERKATNNVYPTDSPDRMFPFPDDDFYVCHEIVGWSGPEYGTFVALHFPTDKWGCEPPEDGWAIDVAISNFESPYEEYVPYVSVF